MSTSTSQPNTRNNSAEQSAATPLPHSSVVLDLAELAEKYAQFVPFRMRVVNGFMAADNMKDPTFVVDEIYSVHLVKEMKVVKTNSAAGEFFIPINSVAKFGLIQDEHKDCITYETVDDLLSAKPIPKVVAVKIDYTNPDKKLSLKKDEVLAVKDVIRARIGRGKIMLKAFSFLSQEEVMLPRELQVKFTTDPCYTQLYLTDLVDHIAMPCVAHYFPISSSSHTSLPSMKITLEGQETCRSVIVSLFRDNPASQKHNATNFIDIPTRININVSIIETSEGDGIYQQIMKESRDLLHDYNPATITACVDSMTDAAYMTQAQLLAEVRREKEKMTLTKSAPQHYQRLLLSEAQKMPEKIFEAQNLETLSIQHSVSLQLEKFQS